MQGRWREHRQGGREKLVLLRERKLNKQKGVCLVPGRAKGEYGVEKSFLS